MQKKIRMNVATLMLMLADMAGIFVAVLLSHLVRLGIGETGWTPPYDGEYSRYFFSGFLFLLTWMLLFAANLYTRRNDFWMETRRIFKAVFLLLLVTTFFAFATKTSEYYSRIMIGLIALNLLWLLPLGRAAAKKALGAMRMWQQPVAVIGESAQAARLRQNLHDNWYLGYRVSENFEAADKVFIATEGMDVEELEAKIHAFKMHKKEVVLVPYLSNISFANIEIIDLTIGRMSLINIQNQLFKIQNIVIKKTAEFFLMLLLLPVLVPVMALIALFIAVDSPGGILFPQRRLGKEGREYTCLKFRTMHANSEQILKEYLLRHPEEVEHYECYHKYRDDPRVTRVGRVLRKFSLDELPQVINVFRGEMSLIGPRPYMPVEREKMGEDCDTILHVLPGLTGLWQISGRNNLEFSQRVELDVWYIQNWSLWLDFIIFVKTFEVLITRRGAG